MKSTSLCAGRAGSDGMMQRRRPPRSLSTLRGLSRNTAASMRNASKGPARTTTASRNFSAAIAPLANMSCISRKPSPQTTVASPLPHLRSAKLRESPSNLSTMNLSMLICQTLPTPVPLLPRNHMTTSFFPPPRKRARISEVTPDKDDEHRTENDPPKTKISAQDHARSISVGSSSGGRRASRNAEAGHQIAHGLKLIGESMSAPIITKADTSHIDAIVDTFAADPSLLPDDPDGSYYALLLDALSANEMRARVFTKTSNRVQRIAFLKRVLLEMKMDVPVDWV